MTDQHRNHSATTSEENENTDKEFIIHFLTSFKEVLKTGDTLIDKLGDCIRETSINDTFDNLSFELNLWNIKRDGHVIHSQEIWEILKLAKVQDLVEDAFVVVLNLILNLLTNYKANTYLTVIPYAENMAAFLKAYSDCTEADSEFLNSYISDFTTILLDRISKLDNDTFLDKGPVFQLMVKIILVFKENSSTRKIIESKIITKLATFTDFVVKQQKKKKTVDLLHYEAVVLYLTILKKVLPKKTLLQTMGRDDLQVSGDQTDYEPLKAKLKILVKVVPFYVEYAIKQCIDLL